MASDDTKNVNGAGEETTKPLTQDNSTLPVHDDLCNSVQELIECHVCANLMYPPIHQCRNGQTCQVKVQNRCPTCRQEFGNIRCLALGTLAESLELSCKYRSSGCQERFPNSNKPKHELQCNFRPYKCPYAASACSVIGDIPFLVSHLKDDHKVGMLGTDTINHRYVKANPHEVQNATWIPTVIHCFGRYFCLHFEAFKLCTGAPAYMAFLRFMGGENEAESYSYRLEAGDNRRRQIWQGIPRSIRDSHQKVRDSSDGLIIPRNMALFYSGGDGKELNLRITGKVWKRIRTTRSF